MTKRKHDFGDFFYKLIKNENLKYLASINIQTLSQYFVEVPLAAIKALSLLGMSVSALHIWIWGFSPILPQRFAQTLSS